MTPVDFIIIAMVGLFVLIGFFSGFLKTLSSLIGTVVAIIGSIMLFDVVNQWMVGLPSMNFFTKAIVFLAIFFLVSKVVGIGILLLNRAFGLIKIVPFAGVADSLLGAVLGFLEGIVFASFSVIFLTGMAYQFVPPETVDQVISQSALINLFMAIGSALFFFLPDSLRAHIPS